MSGDASIASISSKKKIAFASATVVLFLVAVEILARVLGYAPTKPIKGYQESKFRPSLDFIWELVPGWIGSEGGGRIKINSIGLRDDEVVSPKPSGEYRVIALGDSVTFGYLVDQNDVWPRKLERIFGGRVVNAGVPGYSTFQERDWLAKKGWALEPDIVVLAYCLNDAVERYTTVAEYGGKDVFLGVDASERLGPVSRFARRLAIYRLLADMLRQSEKRGEFYRVERMNDDDLPPELSAAWATNSAEIDAIARDVSSRGKPLLVVVLPYLFQVARDGDEPFQRRLSAHCSTAKLDCLDLINAFRARRNEGLFIDANHLSPAGHEVAAEAIAERLKSLHPTPQATVPE